jgi:hypothetical protein
MHEEHSAETNHMNCAHHSSHVADSVMGFEQDKTFHHFILHQDGGSIEVHARDFEDSKSIQQIRTHLQEVSKEFKEGEFTKPRMIHSKLPPGSEDMKTLRSDISYNYEDLSDGGRIKIQTQNPGALRAVHQFLKFQIEEHHTGDPTKP